MEGGEFCERKREWKKIAGQHHHYERRHHRRPRPCPYEKALVDKLACVIILSMLKSPSIGVFVFFSAVLKAVVLLRYVCMVAFCHDEPAVVS